MLKRVKLALSVLGAGLFGFVLFITIYHVKLWSQERQPITPFTATLLRYTVNSAGKKDGAPLRCVTAFRSDGSLVRMAWVFMPDGHMTADRRIFDVATRKETRVFEGTESKNTRPMSDITRHALMSHTQVCSGESGPYSFEVVGHARMLGYDVIHLKRDSPLVKGGSEVQHTEKWVAPELDCYSLYTKGQGSADHAGIDEVISVVHGEPDPALFEVPATYTERSMVEVAREFARRYPGHHIMTEARAKRFDVGYQK